MPKSIGGMYTSFVDSVVPPAGEKETPPGSGSDFPVPDAPPKSPCALSEVQTTKLEGE